jgi:hypothetical protein
MLSLQNAMGQWAVAYFIPIVFIGTWFLLNLTLAVIKSKFTEEHKSKKKEKLSRKKVKKLKTDEDELLDGDGVGDGDGNDGGNDQT